jgi:ribosomal protection tetracycline resistance protein
MTTASSCINLGIVAHVDAGKTTLTERLLFEAGVTNHVGRVDHGDTTTDADALERQRGITIRSAVVTFALSTPEGDVTRINLIDTPGHSDFVAEVERALAVLDGAVLVVSAVEGVQAHTRVLIRILERLGIPFVIFANKVDRVGAAYNATLDALRETLSGDAVAVTEPIDLGSRGASTRPRHGAGFVDELVDRLSANDDRLLRQYVDGTVNVTEEHALDCLARQTADGRMHPVVFGAALTGLGVSDVADAVVRYLPATAAKSSDPLHASVFKIERGPAGHKLAYVRLHAGKLDARDHVALHHRSATGVVNERETRATNVSAFRSGAETVTESAYAGDIATVIGLGEVAIGDQLGRWDASRGGRHFPPPGLESIVQPRNPGDRSTLFEALQQLSEQDPLIDARVSGRDNDITVSVYGEVQKEVIAARLESEYGVVADFLPTRTVYVERVVGIGEAVEKVRTGNAIVGLRVEPGAPDSGLQYGLGPDVERGYLLPNHHVAIEETLPRALAEGPRGWRVVDCKVTLVQSRFCAPTPPAGYYRDLTMSVLSEALRRAGTVLCAPVSEFEAEFPEGAVSAVLQKLHAHRASPQPPVVSGTLCRITGLIPTEEVDEFEQRLPGITGGQGLFFSRPFGYEAVPGQLPSLTAPSPAAP